MKFQIGQTNQTKVPFVKKATAPNIQQLLSSLFFQVLLHQSKHLPVHIRTIHGKLSKLLIAKVTTN